MKLLTKTSLYYLLFGIPVLLIATVSGYFILLSAVNDNNEELLLLRKKQIENYLNQNGSLSHISTFYDETSIVPISEVKNKADVFCDTLISDPEDGHLNPKSMLITEIKTKQKNYLAKIWLSTVDNDELVTLFLTWFLVLMVLIIIVFFTINWYVSKIVWKPFYNIVAVLNTFSASDKLNHELEKTNITEFNDMNNSVSSMIQKMKLDFKNQKKFTENASHEMQTPLAIIKNKIELLIQSKDLKETDLGIILSIDEAAAKLVGLNKSLLLLSKIENQQFEKQENVSLNKIIEESLELFDENIKEKEITILKKNWNTINLNINPYLCSILINNLLQNAVRHNFKKGFIEIDISQNKFSISNSGKAISIDNSIIFERFQKISNLDESTGLGLAIVKEIITSNKYSIHYKYKVNKHVFEIDF